MLARHRQTKCKNMHTTLQKLCTLQHQYYLWWLVWAVPSLPVPLTSDPLTGLMALLAGVEVEVVAVDLSEDTGNESRYK